MVLLIGFRDIKGVRWKDLFAALKMGVFGGKLEALILRSWGCWIKKGIFDFLTFPSKKKGPTNYSSHIYLCFGRRGLRKL